MSSSGNLTSRKGDSVWRGFLATTDEGVAPYHTAKFRAAGGTDSGIAAAFAAAAAWAIGAIINTALKYLEARVLRWRAV